MWKRGIGDECAFAPAMSFYTASTNLPWRISPGESHLDSFARTTGY
jgi:hypothetical protein